PPRGRRGGGTADPPVQNGHHHVGQHQRADSGVGSGAYWWFRTSVVQRAVLERDVLDQPAIGRTVRRTPLHAIRSAGHANRGLFLVGCRTHTSFSVRDDQARGNRGKHRHPCGVPLLTSGCARPAERAIMTAWRLTQGRSPCARARPWTPRVTPVRPIRTRGPRRTD